MTILVTKYDGMGPGIKKIEIPGELWPIVGDVLELPGPMPFLGAFRVMQVDDPGSPGNEKSAYPLVHVRSKLREEMLGRI